MTNDNSSAHFDVEDYDARFEYSDMEENDENIEENKTEPRLITTFATACCTNWIISSDESLLLVNNKAFLRVFNATVITCFCLGFEMKELLLRLNHRRLEPEVELTSTEKKKLKKNFRELLGSLGTEDMSDDQIKGRYRVLKEDCLIFVGAVRFAFGYFPTAHNLDRAIACYYNSGPTRTHIFKRMVNIWKGTSGLQSSISLDPIYNTTLLNVLNESTSSTLRVHFVPEMSANQLRTRNSDEDILEHQRLTRNREWEMLLASPQFRYEERNVRKKTNPDTKKDKGKGKQSSKKSAKIPTKGKKSTAKKPSTRNKRTPPVRPRTVSTNTNFSLAEKGSFDRTYIELAYANLRKKDDKASAAASSLVTKTGKWNAPYPRNIRESTFIEYANLQSITYKNLEQRLHGARTSLQFKEHMKKLNDFGETEIHVYPAKENVITKTNDDLIINGSMLNERWEKFLLDSDMETIDLVQDVFSPIINFLLCHGKMDNGRNVIKEVVGWKVQDQERYEDNPDKVFVDPVKHDAVKKIPDEKIRRYLGLLGLFLQNIMEEELDDEHLFSNEERNKKYGEKVSYELLGGPGFLFEGLQLNAHLMENNLRPRFDPKKKYLVKFKYNEKTGTREMTINGVADHTDANNCDELGYQYLTSISAVLEPNDPEATYKIRAWIGFYFRRCCGNGAVRQEASSQINGEVESFIITSRNFGSDEFNWDVVTGDNTNSIKDFLGVKYVSHGVCYSRLHNIAQFASVISQLHGKFDFDERNKVEQVLVALKFNCGFSFSILGYLWLRNNDCPYVEATEPLPYIYASECQKLLLEASDEQTTNRITFGSSPLWNNVINKRRTTMQEWDNEVQKLMDLIAELQRRRTRIPQDAGFVNRGIGFAIQGDCGNVSTRSYWNLDKDNQKKFAIKGVGEFMSRMVLPLLIAVGLVDARYIRVAEWNDDMQVQSYSKTLSDKFEINTRAQLKSLLDHLEKSLGCQYSLSRSDLEIILGKLYGRCKAEEYYWKDEIIFEFKNGEMVWKTLCNE